MILSKEFIDTLYDIRKDAPPYIIITGDKEMELYGRHEQNAYKLFRKATF